MNKKMYKGINKKMDKSMTKRTDKRTDKYMDDYITLSIQLLEWFKELVGFSDDEFVKYMNENDIWKILDDRENITAYAISAEEEDVVILFGGGLSKDEQYKIISRYHS